MADAAPKGPARWRRLETWAWVLLALGTVAASAWAHVCAGLTMPIPWKDEPWLLWKSLAFLETGSLAAPELNPGRMVVNFPLFELLQAGVAAVAGFDLERLRWGSWLLTMAAYGFSLAWVRRLPLRFAGALVLSLFFLGSSMVAAGNIVRPDALVLALAAACLWLEARGAHWVMAAVAALSAAVHPSGAFLAVVFGPLWLHHVWRRPGWPDRAGRAAIAVAAAAWLGLIAFVLAHRAEVLRDYGLIYGDEMSSDPLHNLWRSGRALWLTWFVAAVPVAAWLERRLVPALLLALSLQALQIVRLEMWYGAHNQFSTALLWIAAAVLGLAAFRRLAPRLRAAPVLACLPLLPLLLFALRHGFIEGPRGYPRDLAWGWGMRATGPVPYATEADRDRIATALRARVAGPASRVRFFPEGDALLFAGRLRGRIGFFLPIDCAPESEWVVWHESRYVPEWAAKGIRSQVGTLAGEAEVLLERDGTERWTLLRVQPAAPSSGP